jgi:hypothetical protein
MFSEEAYEEIGRLTGWALGEMRAPHVIDRVTVIRAYAQLANNQPTRYENKIILNVQDLVELAKQHGKSELAGALEALVARLDQERT